METRIRTIVKAFTWQALGLLTTGALAWFHTGSVLGAVSFALSTAGIGLTFFFVHERLWARVRWGRMATAPESGKLWEQQPKQHPPSFGHSH